MELELEIYFTEQDAFNDIDAIKKAGEVLVTHNAVKTDFIKACVDREKLFPTGLSLPNGSTIAMPHSNSENVLFNSISIVRTKTPVSFGKMEDPDEKISCNLIFNMALSSGKIHVRMLKKLISLFQQKEFIDNCLTLDQASVPQYVLKKLNE
ncbi:PTS sugar transporter subunit IIA [Paenibacillus maysiensis]|uniref:PTS sugar transporter subunit IIA n=1 Tax=Paenibacillus maysiensis TaxID=1155954 RepID=UPI000471F297|nr:PTS sugar transporter subunit IIA [Paenibacillus maysiensis]